MLRTHYRFGREVMGCFFGWRRGWPIPCRDHIAVAVVLVIAVAVTAWGALVVRRVWAVGGGNARSGAKHFFRGGV